MSVEFIRNVPVTNGTETRTLRIESIDGRIMLHDPIADPNSDGLVELAGDTNSDVQDALNDCGEWEVISE